MDGGEGFDIGCDFGVVSLRAQVITFGMKVSRTEMNLDEVDRRLCCKRLTGKLVRGGRSAAPNQALLPGMEGEAHSVEGAFDVKRYGVNANGYTFSLSFSAGSVDANECQKLANSAGRLIVSHVEDLPDEDDGDDDDGHDDHEDVGPRPRTKAMTFDAAPSPACLADLKLDLGAAMPLSTLEQFGTTKGITKSVKAVVGGGTVGHLEKFMAANPEFWHRDIKGVGEEKLTKLQDAHLAFRQQNPMVSDEDRSDIDYAFHQGREAWDEVIAAGIQAANPYPAGDRRSKAWQLGWEAGEADSNAGTVFDQTGDEAAS